MLKKMILASGLAAALSMPALACTCPPIEDAAAQAAEYELVAIAVVDSTEETAPAPGEQASPYGPSTVTEMTIRRVLKGAAGQTVTVKSPPASPVTCGMSYRPGEREILLLTNAREDGTYSTWMCDLPQFPTADFEAALAGGEE